MPEERNIPATQMFVKPVRKADAILGDLKDAIRLNPDLGPTVSDRVIGLTYVPTAPSGIKESYLLTAHAGFRVEDLVKMGLQEKDCDPGNEKGRVVTFVIPRAAMELRFPNSGLDLVY